MLTTNPSSSFKIYLLYRPSSIYSCREAVFLSGLKAPLSINMQPLDPITLALIAVVIAVVLSLLLLLLFASREEKFEDVLAAQRSRLESYQTRAVATKSSKPRKKFSKGKKKNSDDRNVPEEISELIVESAGDSSPDIVGENSEFLATNEVSQDIVEPREEKFPDAEQEPISEPVKERQGKKKQKKSTPKEDNVVERTQPVEKPREVVEEAVSKIEYPPTLESQNLEIEEQKLPERSETVAHVKISKDKTKVAEDKEPIQGKSNLACILLGLCVANGNDRLMFTKSLFKNTDLGLRL